jgi:hypothetical protein
LIISIAFFTERFAFVAWASGAPQNAIGEPIILEGNHQTYHGQIGEYKQEQNAWR